MLEVDDDKIVLLSATFKSSTFWAKSNKLS